MSLLVVTGLSGSGKSQTVGHFEDLGFFCVDNMPPDLIIKFAQMLDRSFGKLKNAVVICDIRSGLMFSKLEHALKNLDKNKIKYEIVFLEASEKVLVARYKETRRKHPLAVNGILDGIQKEKKILEKIRKKSNVIIDTSNFTSKQLRTYINSIYSGENGPGIIINLISFGFKNSLPIDLDLLFDVRFLPNPFYIGELKKLSGKDQKVKEYIMNFEDTSEFLKIFEQMMLFLIPKYEKEGKSQLVIGIGCTGGQHRSVTISEECYKILSNNNYIVSIMHRDEGKNI